MQVVEDVADAEDRAPHLAVEEHGEGVRAAVRAVAGRQVDRDPAAVHLVVERPSPVHVVAPPGMRLGRGFGEFEYGGGVAAVPGGQRGAVVERVGSGVVEDLEPAGPVGAQGVLAGSVGGVELVRGAVVGAQPVADRPHSGAFEAFHQVRGEVARVPVLVGDCVDEGQDVGGGALGVLTADEGDEPVAGVALGVGLDERGAGFGHVPPERLLGVGAARPYLFEEFTQQGASHGGHLGSGGSREGGTDGRGAAGWAGHVRAALRRGWRPSGRAAPRGGTGRRGRW